MVPIRRLTCLALIVLPVITAGCDNSKPVVVKVQDETERDFTPAPSRDNVPSLNGQYTMDVVCDTNAQISIKGIEITDTKTIIGLTFNNIKIGDEVPTDKIRTAAPGQQTAFYIADPDTRVEYKLLNVEGIALEPKFTQVTEGETVDFTLTFERIPNYLTRFHLIEGKVQAVGPDNQPLTTWTFMNVNLK